MISFSDAQKLLISNLLEFGTERVSIESSLNRILAEDILADRDYPPFNRSAMDGFAVNTQWYNALEDKRMPNQGTLLAGDVFKKTIDKTRSLRIMTGAAVPDGLDAVIQVEKSIADCDMVTFQAGKSIVPNLNIAQKGEDIKEKEIILKKNTFLSPQNLQALATVGAWEVLVYKKPRVAIITTGNEIVDTKPADNQIRNSNLWAIKSSLQSAGFLPIFDTHLPDDQQKITLAIENVLPQCDVLIMTGGVSMGDADFVPKCLMDNGIERVFHKVSIKPGKPLWFGKNKDKVVFGLPGNPLSTFLDLHLFVIPFLKNESLKLVKGILAKDQKSASIDRFVPFYFDQNGYVITKKFNGSGDITALVGTDGFLFIGQDTEPKAGDIVEVFLVS